MNRALLTMLALLSLSAVATAQGDAAPATAGPTWATVMARVNGQPIGMDRLNEALVQDYGLAIAQQLIADELVRQECQRKNVPYPVTAGDIAEATERAMNRHFQFDRTLSADEKDKLLQQFLAKNRLTRRQWDVTMARNVRLRRLAGSEVKITDEELRDEYLQQFDGKLRVRHIQVPTLKAAEDLLKQLKAGADFAELAASYSTNPSGKNGGWLPDIGLRSQPTDIPDAIIAAARAMKVPGEVSNPVQVGTNYHILKLEEVVAPKNVKLDAVRGQLTQIVREKKIYLAQIQMMNYLIQQARKNGAIEWVNPALRSQLRKDAAKGGQP